MSRFLRYAGLPAVCVGLLFWASACCYGVDEDPALPYLEFIILDQAGENVLLSNSLPSTIIWYYPEGDKAQRVNPYADVSRGVFVMNVIPKSNYQIDIIDQPFVQLDFTYSEQKGQCSTYDKISGVAINGVSWDYHTKPVLTLVYNP